jgi:hypothetical protein
MARPYPWDFYGMAWSPDEAGASREYRVGARLRGDARNRHLACGHDDRETGVATKEDARTEGWWLIRVEPESRGQCQESLDGDPAFEAG